MPNLVLVPKYTVRKLASKTFYNGTQYNLHPDFQILEVLEVGVHIKLEYDSHSFVIWRWKQTVRRLSVNLEFTSLFK